MEKKNLLIFCTGSVASLKIPELTENLKRTEKFDIRLVPTEKALHFFNLPDVPADVKVYRDEDEWASWQNRGDPVVHIELRKWADIGLIAPLDANTLGKVANGLCDNLLTCCLRAWDLTKPLLFCPAMNTQMFLHPITAKQIGVLTSWGFRLIPSVEKTLICGDSGMGAMALVDTIVDRVVEAVAK